MPTIPFTVRRLESLKKSASGRVDYRSENIPGFGLRISEGGARTWFATCRTKGGHRATTEKPLDWVYVEPGRILKRQEVWVRSWPGGVAHAHGSWIEGLPHR